MKYEFTARVVRTQSKVVTVTLDVENPWDPVSQTSAARLAREQSEDIPWGDPEESVQVSHWERQPLEPTS